MVEHGGQGKHVGAGVERAAIELLGRHVGQRADAVDLGAIRQGVEHAAEVAELDVDHAVMLHHGQDVGWLDVAVDQALAEDIVQRHRALEADFDDLAQWQKGIGAAETPQRRARHIFHHQVGRLGIVLGVVNLNHIGVLQLASQGRFGGEEVLPKAPLAPHAQALLAQTLDGHMALVELVAGEKHLTRRALAQQRQDPVFADALGQAGVVDG